MIAKPATPLIAVVAAIVLGACGSSGSSSSSSSATSSAAPAATSTSTASSASGGGSSSTPNQQAAVAACVAAYAALPLPASSKQQLDSICATAVKAEKGGATPQQVAKQICPQIVKVLPAQIQPIVQAECSKL